MHHGRRNAPGCRAPLRIAIVSVAVTGVGGKSECGANDQSEEKNFVGFHNVGLQSLDIVTD